MVPAEPRNRPVPMAPPRAMSCTCLFFKALFNSGVLLFFICSKLATATPARVALLHKTRYAAGFSHCPNYAPQAHKATKGSNNHQLCQRQYNWLPSQAQDITRNRLCAALPAQLAHVWMRKAHVKPRLQDAKKRQQPGFDINYLGCSEMPAAGVEAGADAGEEAGADAA